MTRPQPSLVRRLLLAFTLGPLVAVMLLIAASMPTFLNSADANASPEIIIALVGADLRKASDGSLALGPQPQISGIASRSKGLWFVVKQGNQELSFGAVPKNLPRFSETLSTQVKEAHFGDVNSSDRAADWSIMHMDTAAGQVTIYAGGIDPKALDLSDWLLFAHIDEEFYLGLFVVALICMAGGPLAIPIVVAGLRPTARAASQLDPADPARRLPEHGVVKELRPIVRAFNAALDRLAEAFERRRRFIADVAHELRTPLAVLNMHVDEMPEGGKKPDLQRMVFRLGQMVGQMLDAERLILAGRERLTVDLVDVARGAVAEIAPLAVANGYEISLAAPDGPVPAQGDRHAIARALSNLLGNALAHGGGSGLIEVRVSSESTIDVVDQGPGIPAEAQERIFEPFHRERWDRDGCGLGLHLVREIMRAHGGRANLVGSGPGAIFRLEFPPQPSPV